MSQQKLAYRNKLRAQIRGMGEYLDAKEREVLRQESLKAQGLVPGDSAKGLKHNLDAALGPEMTPGNVGDVNKVIWPFYFTTENLGAMAPNGTVFNTGFNVTQEAGFVMMSYTKAIYLNDPADTWTYLDPDDNSTTENLAPGLKFSIKDGVSQRVFFNSPIDIGHYGNPRFPTKFPRPMLFLPNQTVQVQFTNMSTTNSYVPFMTFFGYRIRIEDSQRLLSLVYG